MRLPSRTLSGSDLFKHLWEDTEGVPLTYILEVLQDLEPFLLSKQSDPAEFFRFLALDFNRGSFFSAKFLLLLLHPVLENFFSSRDPRLELMNAMPLIFKKAFPDLDFSIVSRSEEGDFRLVSICIRFPIPPSACGKLDMEGLVDIGLRYLPRFFGMPEFEKAEVLCSVLHPSFIIEGEYPGTDETGIFHRGNIKGGFRSFADLCESWGIKEILRESDRLQVPVISEDYHCPLRKRVALSRGVAYAAPVTLVRFRFQKNLPRPKIFLQNFIASAVENRDVYLEEAGKKHREMLDSLSEKMQIHYDVATRRLFVNGRLVAKSLPGAILAKILDQCLKEQRFEFEYREFVLDPNLGLNPLNPNFVLRLNRLSATLRKKCPEMGIETVRRGSFRFFCTQGFLFIQS